MLFAVVASLGWIIERTLNIPNAVGPFVEGVAHHAPWMAMALLLLSLLFWTLRSAPQDTNLDDEPKIRQIRSCLSDVSSYL